jgi:hypothetical protein
VQRDHDQRADGQPDQDFQKVLLKPGRSGRGKFGQLPAGRIDGSGGAFNSDKSYSIVSQAASRRSARASSS